MKKKTNQITNFKYYLPYFIRGIIAFFILLALTLLIYFFELNTPMTTISLLDGLLIATAIGFATSLFTYLVYSGSLNFVSYGFSTFGSIFNKNVNLKYKIHIRNKHKWSTSTIRKILTDEIYIGNQLYL